ncbi:hypothetical protein BCR35DRAFT_302625 [Leucosporidium creatinivorum]|uniref:PAN2-PAN3 deadenylation complex subunit PAN3 n=1 Tax=Leucosporidium creatinivorum TaxID=106004 RepID=A0A1Y2FPS0_9BASI|nr:hypothetical protein BCR35DRAFT_302625 [Leucosporidium creatinivorum]
MSSAIRIVAPSASSSTNTSPSHQPRPPPSSTTEDKKLCRNILIYGQCRFEDKGCTYSHTIHDPNSKPPTPTPNPAPTSGTPLSAKTAASAQVFVPGGAAPAAGGTTTPGGGSMGAGAQEFIPRRAETPALSEDAPFFTPASQRPQPPGLNPLASFQNKLLEAAAQQGAAASGAPSPVGSDAQQQGLAEYYSQMDLNGEYAALQAQQMHDPSHQGAYDYSHGNGHGHAHGQDPYFGAQGGMGHFVRQPLQYHLYHPLPSSAPTSSSTGSGHSSFFLPPSLHISLTSKSEATHATPSVDMKLPEEVGGYTGLMPLDKAQPAVTEGGGGWAGYRSWVYKAWKEGDGRAYCLRRIEGFRLQHEQAISVVEKWTRIRHPGLVAVREAFTTRAFGDHSIIFVYDYHPTSLTLYESHLSPLSSLPPNPCSGAGGIPERLLWSYIVQLGSTIKAIHNSGMALRGGLEVNRVLVTGKNRVRVGGAGVLDVLLWEGQGVGGYQQDDLLSFGKLIISLSCGSPSSVHNLPKSVDHISRCYSPDLKNVVLYLLSKPGPRKTIEEVLALMGARVLDELNASFVFDHDPRWAETGDRYLIKLFRDFVFHQVDENGRPVTDLSHVVMCLNKLDAGVDEKIMLVSRDEQSCLIVSYREIKNCIEGAFLDLSR